MTLTVDAFIAKWTASGGSERANYVSFLNDLCDIIGAPLPDATREDDALNNYVYERAVTFHHDAGTTSVGRIDLYKRDCFVLEAKQGAGTVAATQTEAPFVLSTPEPEAKKKKAGTAKRGTAGWSDAMERAFGQAKGYARALPKDHGYPPFIIVVDVGHSIDLYVDFARSGKFWSQFPDAHSFRITMNDLRDEKIRARLKTVFTDPMSLDPSRYAAAVTRELAAKLADLAKSLEAAGHNAESVATFLMRCLFTLFSEDIGLLKKESFQHYLEGLRAQPHAAAAALTALWRDMNTGSPFNGALMGPVLRFNGGLFADASALPLDAQQIDLLIHAAKADWTNVEPAIFGTLLERALDPVERHRLGAHYTPRAYVERLVIPTVIEPLREDWEAVRTAAVMAANRGDQAAAIAFVREFHGKLCNTRVLDPACGSGNFLYVTLEHMKRLEGEVLQMLYELDEKQGFLDLTEVTVDPHQFLGIEVNVRAAKIAEMVLWIGYLQWHYRTRGQVNPPEPVIRDFKNIECRDAVLDWDGDPELVRDERGVPVTRWDGRSMKKHPVTGDDVPDETKTVPVWRYVNPRKAEWPKADFVIGNPPFIGNKRMRTALGDGYVEALRKAHGDVSEAVDLVMYWWDHAARLANRGELRRFGLITTNSITQAFNRGVIEKHQGDGIGLAYAIPDHPWVDSESGAAVRIAMTVASANVRTGTLQVVFEEFPTPSEDAQAVSFSTRIGNIHADLTAGPNIAGCKALAANDSLSTRGVIPHGAGFLVTREQAAALGVGSASGVDRHIRPYLNGRDLAQVARGLFIIDAHPLTIDQLRQEFPDLLQWILVHVKPERDQERDRSLRERWWLHRRTNEDLRNALRGLTRYIVTLQTSKHRVFVFLDGSVLPDDQLIAFGLADASAIGVLSSRVHVTWALAAGGHLGVGNDPRYNKTRCFEPFPFPAATENQRARIRELGEQLDAHRKRQQAAHPDLTITGMYNVLEKLRSGEALNAKDKVIHEQGLVSVLKQIHDELDIAVFDAYGWPSDLTDEQILERLVALNAERAEEEKRGLIRWLRPEYQNPAGQAAVAQVLDLGEAAEVVSAAVTAPKPWPKTMPEQVALIRDALAGAATVSAKALAKLYKGVGPEKVEEVLVTLAALGQARMLEDGRFVGVRAA